MINDTNYSRLPTIEPSFRPDWVILPNPSSVRKAVHNLANGYAHTCTYMCDPITLPVGGREALTAAVQLASMRS